MAVYKVPQDVEADDKLLGPFSFRQFIYLMVVAACLGLAWFLGTIFIGLALIPIPIVLFFGALALPLKKDQPMEAYLAAVVQFYLKPRKRTWKADGRESLIEITVPKTTEVQRTKDISYDEASKRLSYLANVVDSEGWAIKGVANAQQSALREDVYNDAMKTEDMLDLTATASSNIDQMIHKNDQVQRETVINNMKAAFSQDDTLSLDGQPQIVQHGRNMSAPAQTPVKQFQPMPPNPNHPVVQPIAPAYPTTANPQETGQEEASKNTPSPDIINLANNSDLSIETIAREADRIAQKESQDEVFISLR